MELYLLSLLLPLAIALFGPVVGRKGSRQPAYVGAFLLVLFSAATLVLLVSRNWRTYQWSHAFVLAVTAVLSTALLVSLALVGLLASGRVRPRKSAACAMVATGLLQAVGTLFFLVNTGT